MNLLNAAAASGPQVLEKQSVASIAASRLVHEATDVGRSISLLSSTAKTTIIVALVACVAVAVAALRARPRRVLGAAVVTAMVAGLVWLVLDKLWRPFPDPTPAMVYLVGSIGVFVVVAATVAVRWRIVAAIVAIIAAATAWAGTNLIYQQYPTLASLWAKPRVVEMSIAQFQEQKQSPLLDGEPAGALVTVPAKGSASGFSARDAVAYVPPAYWTQPSGSLPVLVLLAGNPGAPQHWFTSGQAADTADNYQSEHNGLSPIIVSVDGTGSLTGNPLCVDSDNGNVQTYLAHDVPEIITQAFPKATTNTAYWTLGGLSYGGTCALQIATNAPGTYGAILDMSGQAEPTIGTRAQTVQKFFDGNEDDFVEHNPADILAASAPGAAAPGDFSVATPERLRALRKTEVRFVAGENDKTSVAALSKLNDLARQAGMSSSFSTLPGGHSYEVWRRALRENLDWVMTRKAV